MTFSKTYRSCCERNTDMQKNLAVRQHQQAAQHIPYSVAQSPHLLCRHARPHFIQQQNQHHAGLPPQPPAPAQPLQQEIDLPRVSSSGGASPLQTSLFNMHTMLGPTLHNRVCFSRPGWHLTAAIDCTSLAASAVRKVSQPLFTAEDYSRQAAGSGEHVAPGGFRSRLFGSALTAAYNSATPGSVLDSFASIVGFITEVI